VKDIIPFNNAPSLREIQKRTALVRRPPEVVGRPMPQEQPRREPPRREWVESRSTNGLRVSDRPIALPRMCGIHGRPWGAWYLASAQGIEHTNSFRLTDDMNRTNFIGDSEEFMVSSKDFADEVCAWCGVAGVFWCSNCLRWICMGRSTAKGYLRCCCGHEGKALPYSGYVRGLIPRGL
jgi:hypothetical protein